MEITVDLLRLELLMLEAENEMLKREFARLEEENQQLKQELSCFLFTVDDII